MSLHNVGPGPIDEMKFPAVFAGIKYYDFFFPPLISTLQKFKGEQVDVREFSLKSNEKY